ncbi:hypothetical protein BpHYR1_043757 [Brachionus plicatilis]|uniref:Uncharacterized protein n=1 Tax=Brachionus plicatilis TaxID=10195 RepID=A0A3M7Q1X0_BRAPC|nr:hypothetical protein BpHYR1_043757 [Brachionus plicatilis]
MNETFLYLFKIFEKLSIKCRMNFVIKNSLSFRVMILISYSRDLLNEAGYSLNMIDVYSLKILFETIKINIYNLENIT